MKKLLVVTSSVREGRAADNVLKFVKEQLATYPDYEVTVADLKVLPMPFFDSAISPSQDGFTTTNENINAWTKMVGESDAVIFLTAEYNHSMTAVLKNAIDWVYKEWAGKPVTFVGYGWAGGTKAIAAVRIVMGSSIAARATETEANLYFMKQVDLEGTITDEVTAATSFKTVIDELSMMLSE
jgi:NAD(P)H-dependent FMN reductase